VHATSPEMSCPHVSGGLKGRFAGNSGTFALGIGGALIFRLRKMRRKDGVHSTPSNHGA
jgi:hypothetical protein